MTKHFMLPKTIAIANGHNLVLDVHSTLDISLGIIKKEIKKAHISLALQYHLNVYNENHYTTNSNRSNLLMKYGSMLSKCFERIFFNN